MNTPIISGRLAVLDNLKLNRGSNGLKAPCVMNVVDYITGGDGNIDRPACASIVITNFAIGLNDSDMFASYRDELIPYIVKIAGTAVSKEHENRLAYMAADLALRVIAPMALFNIGLVDQAIELRALPEIIDKKTASAARVRTSAARGDAEVYADSANNGYAVVAYHAAEATAHASHAALNAIYAEYRNVAYYAFLAVTHAALATDLATDDTEKYWNEALSLLDRMTAYAHAANGAL